MAIELDDDVRHGIVYVPTFWNKELGEDEYLLIKELVDKPEYCKFAGSLGFPSETRKNFDCTDWCTYRRLLHEELGMQDEGDLLLEFVSLGHRFSHGVDLTVIQKRVTRRFISNPYVRDVEHGGWYNAKKILELGTQGNKIVRMETVPVLKFVISNTEGALI